MIFVKIIEETFRKNSAFTSILMNDDTLMASITSATVRIPSYALQSPFSEQHQLVISLFHPVVETVAIILPNPARASSSNARAPHITFITG